MLAGDNELGGAKRRDKREYRQMTVVLIRDRKDKDSVEVAFSESARFYALLRENRKFDEILRQLHEARENRRTVHVMMDSPEGSVIQDVRAGD